ncbi:MAG: hypothetical protein A4E69_01514 [Syntrophus sp. PtaB.Bin138]|nr:MAG: hypothetical protein A4E69_01514 [Syntrophus sp. PtaB.Bin138]
MNPKSFIILLAVLVPLVFTVDPVLSQSVPRIMDIPESLPVPQRQELTTQRDRLMKARSEMREKTDSHNRQCANVEVNSAIAATCAIEQTRLKERIIAYGEEVKKYNESVKKALAEAPPDVVASVSPFVRKEQEEFDQRNAEWLRRQQKLIKQAVGEDKAWTNEAIASIKALRVPNPDFRPQSLDELKPGDILLLAPDDSLLAAGITVVDPLYRAIDFFSAGNVSAPGLKRGAASHALTFIRTVNGDMLFLDHTKEGSRVLNRDTYLRQYGKRTMYIARPQAKVDGRKLWEVAREAAMKKKSDYGLIGKNVVCSERAAIAVAKATGTPIDKEHHTIKKFPGPVDITPNDFFDGKHVGKFFLVSATPFLPAKEQRGK